MSGPVLLNGRLHDWVSMVCALGPPIGRVPLTIQAMDFPDHGREKVLIYGTGKMPIGYTRGVYKPSTLGLTLLAAEWSSQKELIGSGYGDIEIPAITTTFIDALVGLTPITYSFLGSHLVSEKPEVSQGTDPLKVSLTFQPNLILFDGLPYTIKQRSLDEVPLSRVC